MLTHAPVTPAKNPRDLPLTWDRLCGFAYNSAHPFDYVKPLSEPHKDDDVRITYSDHLPRHNNNRRIGLCHDDRDRHHDDSLESLSAGQLHQCQPDNAIRRRPDILSKAKSCFNIFLNILPSSYITIMFLRAVFSMFALQMIFRTPEQSC